MIDHVMLMNLERREDKWYFALGALRACDFPFSGDNAPWGNTIIRFLSHDAEDYEDIELLIDAASADGFTYFERYPWRDEQGKRTLAWLWTWHGALREIANMDDKIVMLLIDDFLPKSNWTYGRFRKLVRECHATKILPFKGIQLRTSDRAEYVYPNQFAYTSCLRQGFYSSNNNAFILSSMGALLLLETSIEVFPKDSVHSVYVEASKQANDVDRRQGFWSTLDDIVDMGYYSWESDLWK